MNVSVSHEKPLAVSADALVVNRFDGERPADSDLQELDQALQGALTRLLELGELPRKLYQTAVLPSFERIGAPRVVVVGAGKRADFDANRARNVAGAAIRAICGSVGSVAIWFHGDLNHVSQVEAIANGAVLAPFDPGEYKTKRDDEKNAIENLTILGPAVADAAEIEDAARRGRLLGEAANLARHLSNAPGNLLPPGKLAEEAQRVGTEVGFQVEVLDRDQMAALGMGALLGVAQGSDQPPAMIVMTYRGRGGNPIDLAIIGKGVTFDTGGISIKGAADMHLMKEDMAGAAATIAAMRAIAEIGIKANVLGLVPTVENMISGHAMRPGDVLTAMNGKTIEVLNTDAEGRLILADAVCYAQRLGAKLLVDAATLTGAVIIALGHEAAGLLGTPQSWVDQIRGAAERAGERLWQLPLFDEYADQLESLVADVANIGGRPAGTITGAMFIRQFVDDGVSWAHLDIAGTSWSDHGRPYLAKGPTGFPVRTFVALAEAVGEAAASS